MIGNPVKIKIKNANLIKVGSTSKKFAIPEQTPPICPSLVLYNFFIFFIKNGG